MTREKPQQTVHGIHAPAPRLTPWAAGLVALLLSLLFLAGLGFWRLLT